MTTPAPAPGLDARVVCARGGFTLDVAVHARPREVVALLGPNGSGKSSVLRVLAGLTPLRAGHVHVAGEAWDEPAHSVRLPAPRRRVGMVFQATLLFPHLSSRDNVAYGLRHATPRRSRTLARRAAQEWLELSGLADLADQTPAQLSGGQQQRVAIVRALATDPALLLLDEPLSALDAAASMGMRRFLRTHLSRFPGVTVLVTHDAIDALVLADTVVVLDAGKVSQDGTPTEVASRPRSAHVAALLGLNLVRGETDGRSVRTPTGAEVVAATGFGPHGAAFASFAPKDVTVTLEAPHGSARNVWSGRIIGVAPHGDAVRLQVDGPVPLLADITPQALADLSLDEGSSVWCSVKAVEVDLYPA